MTCPKCKAEIPDGSVRCPECGVDIDKQSISPTTDPAQETNFNINDPIEETLRKAKIKLLNIWSGMSVFYKALTALLILTVLLLIVSICADVSTAKHLSWIQLALLIVAFAIHRGVLKVRYEWIKCLALVAVVILVIPNMRSYFNKNHTSVSTTSTSVQVEAAEEMPDEEDTSALLEEESVIEIESEPESEPEPEVVETTYTIEKGTEYAYMSDEWNVYIATAISDSIIQVENWHKNSSATKTLEYDHDVGTYKINDTQNSFFVDW